MPDGHSICSSLFLFFACKVPRDDGRISNWDHSNNTLQSKWSQQPKQPIRWRRKRGRVQRWHQWGDQSGGFTAPSTAAGVCVCVFAKDPKLPTLTFRKCVELLFLVQFPYLVQRTNIQIYDANCITLFSKPQRVDCVLYSITACHFSVIWWEQYKNLKRLYNIDII